MLGIGLSLASTVGKNYIDSALAFNLPLKTSLVPQKAVGSATPTFTRATTATVMGYAADAVAGSSLTLLTVASGEARFQGARRVSQGVWSPVLADGSAIADATLDGYLAEGARTNLLLQSDVLATQNVTVSAVANTLSFYGTGTVTLSGVSTSGPLVGTGSNDRVTLTFTPTAGTLTLTVSGSVTKAQLEAGSFASSYIPTTTAAVTRNADSLTYASAGNANAAAGAIYCEAKSGASSSDMVAVSLNNGSTANNTFVFVRGSDKLGMGEIDAGGVNQAYNGLTTTTPGTRFKAALAYAANDFRLEVNGGAIARDTSVSLPAITTINIGSRSASNSHLFGAIRNLRIYSRALPDSTLQGMTT